MADISLERVTKRYPNDVPAVQETTLKIESGEFLVLVGPSGSGKSTLLRMIAGLEEVTSGTITIAGRDVTGLPPERRDIAMVFQSYALYPNMTVAANLGFGLRMRNTPRPERDARVREVAEMLGLTEVLARRPGALSGGQRQRVAMGRAIVREPQVFLLDEPLSNLDAQLRVSMRASLKRLHERLNVTTVYVTHDQVEATTLGHRVAVLRDGRLQQCDTPACLYDTPANLFVASFIGSPAMNFVDAELSDGRAFFAGSQVRLPPHAPKVSRAIVGFRPSDLQLLPSDGGDRPSALTVRAEVVEELGSECMVAFTIDAPPISMQASARAEDKGAPLLVDARRSELIATFPGRNRAGAGETIRLGLDPSRLHFFDPQTGAAIRQPPPSNADGKHERIDVRYALPTPRA